MRKLLLVLSIAGLMATVWLHAASFTGSPDVLGGDDASVAAVTWKLTDGMVTGAVVSWTPDTDSNYTITVTVGGSSGSVFVASSGVRPRDEALALSLSVSPEDVSTANVVIRKV